MLPVRSEKNSTCVPFCSAATFVGANSSADGAFSLSECRLRGKGGWLHDGVRIWRPGRWKHRERQFGGVDKERRGGTVLVRACWSQSVETSVEVLWFHQPRLRSVRPAAPSHTLWYALLPPPKPSPLAGSPGCTRRPHRQQRAAVVVSHVSSSTSSGWFHLCVFLRWSRTFGLLCSRWRSRRSNKAGALKQPARHLKAQSARFPTRPYYVISANWESSGNEKISSWFRWFFFFPSQMWSTSWSWFVNR